MAKSVLPQPVPGPIDRTHLPPEPPIDYYQEGRKLANAFIVPWLVEHSRFPELSRDSAAASARARGDETSRGIADVLDELTF